MQIEKRKFIPIRPAFINNQKVPKTWICNILKEHIHNRTVNEDSPDKKTLHLECHCVQCIELNSDYRIGRPVQVSHSYTQEVLERLYVGIWYTRSGWKT